MSSPITPTRTTDGAVTPIKNKSPYESPVKTTNEGPNTDVYTTRSGRTVKPVKRLDLSTLSATLCGLDDV